MNILPISVEEFSIAEIERFWDKVDRSAGDDGCWLWTGRLDRGGYGSVWRGRKKRATPAHKFSFTSLRGEVPKDLQVLHRCDVRNCVNPKHLFLGTIADNMADKTAKGRQLKGEKIKASKLTEA
jgi:hypothetical protein